MGRLVIEGFEDNDAIKRKIADVVAPKVKVGDWVRWQDRQWLVEEVGRNCAWILDKDGREDCVFLEDLEVVK